MIPKLAHFIWFGRKPSWVTDNIELFKKFHPGWQVKLHDETTNWRDYISKSLLPVAMNVKCFCQRADILRYSILKKEGGIYLDVDVVTLHSFEDFRSYECFGAVDNSGDVNCAILGSVRESRGISQILLECETVAKNKSIGRTSFGPALLTKLFVGDRRSELVILPSHYFYLFDRKEAHQFWMADEIVRQEMIDVALESGLIVKPYAVHLWGIEFMALRSSKHTTLLRGDALAYYLRDYFKGQEIIIGAEVGVLRGWLSEHILRACLNLKLYMIDRWCMPDPNSQYAKSGDLGWVSEAAMRKYHKHAIRRTRFASDRRVILQGESIKIAEDFEDGSLDFVFIDADHTYEGVYSDLRAWFPKVRCGGLVSGHDIDNPYWEQKLKSANGNAINQPWGVRKALTEFIDEICPGTEFEVGMDHTFFFIKPLKCEGESGCQSTVKLEMANTG